ncbi:MAG: hypothetical protein JXA83_06110 [Acidimicrobiales bacterium]|nr:hypothetical protein [Acidimicrobiales bacterium]
MSDDTPSTAPPSGAPAAPPEAPKAPGASVGDTLRWLVAAACVGAAVIHFAYAPTHIDENGAHGAFFLTVAWAQLAVGFSLARWREVRWPWTAAAALNAAVIAVWLLSRTAGVPGSDAEAVGFPDALATGLEAVAVVAALVALRPALAARPAFRLSPVLGAIVAVALVASVSASVTPSIAGEHGHDDGSGADHDDDHGDHPAEGETAAADGHDHGAAEAVADVDPDDRCDLGFNTAAFNEVSVPGRPHAHDDGEPVDFTLDEWAEVFVDPDDGIPPAVVVDFIEDRPVMRDGILTGGLTHTLDPDPWNPMTDPDECAALADELRRAKEVAARYPTIADAEAAGYRKVTTYYPGIAAHYMNFDHLQDGFVLEEPEMLLYDGDGPEAGVVGLSYYILQEGDEEPTEGFTGDNDHYHRHVGLCFKDGVVAAGSNTSEEECADVGGEKSDGSAGWMSHVWITPGCESDWGVFSGANPALKVRGMDTTGEVPTGCGTGKTMDDDLAFDTSGDGPSV